MFVRMHTFVKPQSHKHHLVNPEALLRAVVRAIFELRKAAHHTTVPPTDCPDEGDSGAEEEGEEKGEEAAVAENAVQYLS